MEKESQEWNEDESDEECSEGLNWKLGFVDDPNPALLQAKYFPSKVGGVPIWYESFKSAA